MPLHRPLGNPQCGPDLPVRLPQRDARQRVALPRADRPLNRLATGRTLGGIFSRVGLTPAFAIEHLDLDGDTAVVGIHDGGAVRIAEGDERRMNLTELLRLRRREGSWRIRARSGTEALPPLAER